MDKTCATVSRLIDWVEGQQRPPLHYVANARSYRTAPAPYIELVFIAEGAVPELVMRPTTHAIPAGHVALHNVHFGNMAPRETSFRGWCAFLYVGDVKSLADLGREPWLHALPAARPVAWEQKFQRLAERARVTEWISPRYPVPPDMLARRKAAASSRWQDLYVKTALLDLLAQLLEEATVGGGKAADARPEAVVRGLNFMESHYAQPGLRLADIAAAVSLSEDHFGRLFARHEGDAPMRRLRRIRITRSGFLLRQTDMRVEEVAREVGFDDPFHFSRAFKTIQGVSPRAFRET